MKIRNRKVRLLIATLLLVSFILSSCVRVNPEADKNTVVATVYGEDIKKAEFTSVFEIFKYEYEQKYGADVWSKEVDGKKFIDVAKEKVLDMLIDNKVQLKKAAEMNITVTDAEINEVIDKAQKQFDSEEKFKEFLATQKMSFEYFKDSAKTNLILNKLYEKQTENVTVTEDELKTYYNENVNQFYSVKASHILLKTEEEAKTVLAKVKAGEDFSALAVQYSTDPTAKDNKGDLGYFKRGQMVEAFETAAFALKAGEISDIVKTDFGFHIIKVFDVKLDKFEDSKDQIKSDLLSKKKSDEYQKMLEDMKKKANIKKFVKSL